MKFRRYGSYMRDLYTILGVTLLIAPYVILNYANKQERFSLTLSLIVFYILAGLTVYKLIGSTVKFLGGNVNDYIVFTCDRAELHSNETTVFINWQEVTEIREVILGRGMRQIKIFAKDGTMISFASDGGREKIIWEMHPELKVKYRRRCNH